MNNAHTIAVDLEATTERAIDAVVSAVIAHSDAGADFDWALAVNLYRGTLEVAQLLAAQLAAAAPGRLVLADLPAELARVPARTGGKVEAAELYRLLQRAASVARGAQEHLAA